MIIRRSWHINNSNVAISILNNIINCFYEVSYQTQQTVTITQRIVLRIINFEHTLIMHILIQHH